MIRAMAEEFPRGRIDAVGTAAIIDLVQIQFEDLVLREFALDRQCQDPFAELAAEFLLARQKHVARELLRDRGAALHPAAAPEPHLDRAGDADRIDPQMRAEAAILHRDRRGAHDVGDAIVGQPFAIARPERDDDGAVRGMDSDHLAVGGGFQLLETRQLVLGDIDRDPQPDRAQHREPQQHLHQEDEPAAPGRPGFTGGTRTSHLDAGGYAVTNAPTSGSRRLAWPEIKRDRVHAIAKPGGRRPVGKDMPHMAVAPRAPRLGAGHAVAMV